MGKQGAEIDFNPFFHLLPVSLNRNTKFLEREHTQPPHSGGKNWESPRSMWSTHTCAIIIKDTFFQGRHPGSHHGHSPRESSCSPFLYRHSHLCVCDASSPGPRLLAPPIFNHYAGVFYSILIYFDGFSLKKSSYVLHLVLGFLLRYS